MKQYLDLLRHVLDNGKPRSDRTGVCTLGVFGYQMRFNLADGFPLVTTKKVHLKSIVHELLWFLSGDTNVKYLHDNGVRIWDAWATKEQCAKFGREAGDLGPVYGRQWVSYGATSNTSISGIDGVDQIAKAVGTIRLNPDSRRIIVNAWNPQEVDQVALPPCHTMFQFYVSDGELSCQLFQRSADIMLGLPFNIASYALLTMMMAQVTGLRVGEFIHTLGDAHLYTNHLDQAREQLTREPRALPKMQINPDVTNIFAFKYEDFALTGYDPHHAIKASVAV